MKKIVRAEYKATLKMNSHEATIRYITAVMQAVLEEEKQKERILTGGVFRHESDCFLYLEYIVADDNLDVSNIPNEWFAKSKDFFDASGWTYMQPVFWTDEPKSLTDWVRKITPEQGCGRIAVLFPDKAESYVSHHLALSEEGLLVGDRYQFISKIGYTLFSYFETPRTNERVNKLRSTEPSIEIQKWESVDPDSHFYHFPEADGANFLVIETLCWVNLESR